MNRLEEFPLNLRSGWFDFPVEIVFCFYFLSKRRVEKKRNKSFFFLQQFVSSQNEKSESDRKLRTICLCRCVGESLVKIRPVSIFPVSKLGRDNLVLPHWPARKLRRVEHTKRKILFLSSCCVLSCPHKTKQTTLPGWWAGRSLPSLGASAKKNPKLSPKNWEICQNFWRNCDAANTTLDCWKTKMFYIAKCRNGRLRGDGWWNSSLNQLVLDGRLRSCGVRWSSTLAVLTGSPALLRG